MILEKIPSITVEGKEIAPPSKITVGLYRAIVKSNTRLGELPDSEEKLCRMVEICLEDLAYIYGVDKEILTDELELADVLPLRRDIAEFVTQEVTRKLADIPNAEAAAE